jgi:serine/threonine protein kinase/WD40 repeat protein
MQDDYSANPDDETIDSSEPNAETYHSDTAEIGWLDSNVGVRGDEWIGFKIGDFEIIRIIGIGGMGNVYEAKQTHPHRSVALKIVKSAAATSSALNRFEMESELLARLQHPGIAQVYDSGHQILDDVQLPYFAMEFVPGSHSITDYSEDNNLSRKGRLELFLMVCDAVQYGHGRGVIHRDLKPSNILITSAGRPKVIDFGVALMAGADEVEKTVTVAGKFVGTLQWSSPEQCGDDPHDVDVRTDVYSLGVLLYQLMTGELPYVLKGIPLYRAPVVIRETNPKLPRSVDNSIAVEIEQILLKALAKDRSSRYESVADMAMDIRRYLNNQPILAKPPSTIHKLRLYARRNQLKFRAGLIVFLALVLGLTGLIWGFVESEARQRDMKLALEAEATARSVAEQKAYVAMIGTSQAAIANNAWGMARHHLATTNRDKRGWEWHYLQGIADQSIRTWLFGDRPVSLSSSPDAETLVVTFDSGRVVLIDESRDVTRDITLSSKVNEAAFSKNGGMVFLGMESGSIAILNLENDTMVLFDEQLPPIESIASLYDNLFATGHADGNVLIWNVDGELVSSIAGGRGMVLSLDFDYEQQLIAIGTIDGTVQVWKLDDSQPILLENSHGGAVHSVHFIGDGSLASGGADGKIIIWDIDSKTHYSFESNHNSVMGVSSLGETLSSVGLDGMVRLWSLEDFTLLDTLKGHTGLIWSIKPVSDNRYVSVGKDGSIRWWSASPAIPTTHQATSSMPASDIAFIWNDALVAVSEFNSDMQVIDIIQNESHLIPSDGAELSVVEFVPNTSFAVTGDLDGEIRLWDIENLKQEGLLGSCDGQITAIDVVPNGNFIATATLGGQISVFNRRERMKIFESTRIDSIVLAIAFNGDGDELFVSTINGTILALDLNSGEVLWERIGGGSDVVAMIYIHSRDAILTATASNTLQLISETNGEVIESSKATGGTLRDVGLLPDESRFVTALSDGTVGVWDTQSFTLIASLPAKQALECITVSSDGHRLAIAGGSETIQLLDGMSRRARLKNSTHE